MKNQETKQIFSIRKLKTGTHSALLAKFGIVLASTVVLGMGTGMVHADEATATPSQPTTAQVAPATTATPTTPSAVTSDIPTSVPAGTSQDKAKTEIDKAQDTLKDTVSGAEKSGVEVTNGGTTEVTIDNNNAVDKSKEILTDLNKQDIAVKEAQKKQAENEKAYEESKLDRDKAVSKGQSDLEHSTSALDDEIALAEKNKIPVTTDTKNMTPKYLETKGLTGQALKDAMTKNIALYNEAVKNAVTLQDKSTADMKKKIDDYLLALANYKAGKGSNTGLKWQSGVKLEAGSGAVKQKGNENVVNFGDGTIKTAGMYATQGGNLDQNKDANFDNIFKINGTGTIWVRNTTNGDVKLTFSDINSPYNTGTYVAIWGDNKGGIAWSVFALYNGGATGGVGEGGSGGGSGVSGRILNYVYSYKGKAETTKGVSVATINDVDNNQTVKLTGGLDGTKVTNGKNIKHSGNNFEAGAGDVSEGSLGELGSNGIRWEFNEAKTVSFSFDHSTTGKNTSIVAGIFGASSDIPKEPVAPKLEAHKATVEAPASPEKPANQQVTVHYYTVKTTPETPVTPPSPKTPVAQQSIISLPHTGDEAKGSVVMTALGALMVSFVGFTSIKKKKEEN
ncbi:YSIRK-type signal peptide-containing protein [Streptococcus iniae]|uniref:YSIRK-type signal peptide-containing protein n=1 Tax=Streptococcus agalactiae TaxID=1311 RepID=UPI0008D90C2B|nr:YSIRK-type signal peptide-containing protein [Streptococcus agalactiae]KAF0052049.1 YSIRK-type signal peptide-containing protein [Streptococcus agalactiae]OHX26613.1 signal peptide protein [Streptococcus iniae]